jgi:hypothetical protein
MAKTTAKPIAKTAANQELPKRNDGIHPPIVESEGIVGEPLRLGKGRGGDEVRGCALADEAFKSAIPVNRFGMKRSI